MKIMDHLGVILSWLIGRLNWTISCVYRDNCGKLQLKFWGYVWEDIEQTRNLTEPDTEILNFPNQTIIQIREAFKTRDPSVSDKIFHILDRIKGEMSVKASDFENNIRQHVDLTKAPCPSI
jgi:hypothetical protein